MENNKILFWNVDTQYDFINPNGKLYVKGAEEIKAKLETLSLLAEKNNIKVINTSDYHSADDDEISNNPDFINTFPSHCIAKSPGAEFIVETKPKDDFIELLHDKEYSAEEIKNICLHRNIIIRKNKFDVFTGNIHTSKILDILKPEKIYVYGVSTNVCVDWAVKGLAKKKIEIIVINDAIKELPNISLPFKDWDKLSVKRILLKDIDIY